MRKALTQWMMIAVIAAAMPTTSMAAADGPTSPQTPDALGQNKRLGRGVNVLGYDPIWNNRQKARFQEKHFRLIKEAGFNHVRINLHPFRDAKLGQTIKSMPRGSTCSIGRSSRPWPTG